MSLNNGGKFFKPAYLPHDKWIQSFECFYTKTNQIKQLKGLCQSFVNKPNTHDIVHLWPPLLIGKMVDGAPVH